MKNLNIIHWLWLGLVICLLDAAPAHAFYNPQQGRWLNRDPIEEKGGLNLCAIAGNNAVGKIDSLGQGVFSQEDKFFVYKGPFTPKPVKCPTDGPVCCVGKKIGEVKLLMLVIDASNVDSFKTEGDGDLDEMNKNFTFRPDVLKDIGVPNFIGGGPYLKFEPNAQGKTCCKKFIWRQTVIPGESGNDGSYSNDYFADIPGKNPSTWPGDQEWHFNLELLCNSDGNKYTVWQITWNMKASWRMTRPQSSVTVNFPWKSP